MPDVSIFFRIVYKCPGDKPGPPPVPYACPPCKKVSVCKSPVRKPVEKKENLECPASDEDPCTCRVKKKLREQKWEPPNIAQKRFSIIDTDKGAPYYSLFRKKEDPLTENTDTDTDEICRCRKKHKKTKKEREEEKKKKKEPYKPTKPKKWKQEDEERHKMEQAKYYLCPKGFIRISSPIENRRVDKSKIVSRPFPTRHVRLLKDVFFQPKYESVGKGGEVVPEKISLTDSMGRPIPEIDKDVFALKGPKSKIFINRKKKDQGKRRHRAAVDSFDYIYNEDYRRQNKK